MLKITILLFLAALLTGCSSSGGNKNGHRGTHAQYHWDLHVGVGDRVGYSSEQINKYSISVNYKLGDGKNSTWYYMDSCSCHAWNEKLGKYKHNHVYASGPELQAVPAWLGSHESLHEYIESNPEHGGDPLPDQFRRGGNPSHPDQIYVLGKWKNCRTLVGGRWPALIAKSKPLGGVPPFVCEEGSQANNWHK